MFDDDKELVGQRCLPVNHIRPGFRYIPLRDKHNQPLPLAMLFVNIKVEDWVPNEFEGTYNVHVYTCVCTCMCMCVCVCARARARVCVCTTLKWRTGSIMSLKVRIYRI